MISKRPDHLCDDDVVSLFCQRFLGETWLLLRVLSLSVCLWQKWTAPKRWLLGFTSRRVSVTTSTGKAERHTQVRSISFLKITDTAHPLTCTWEQLYMVPIGPYWKLCHLAVKQLKVVINFDKCFKMVSIFVVKHWFKLRYNLFPFIAHVYCFTSGYY